MGAIDVQQKTIAPLIQTKGLCVVYNQNKPNEVRSLWDVNITIYPEEFVIIFGPSGCGKSTLLYSIASLQAPTSGDVILKGKPFSKFTKGDKLDFRRTGMGMIFQAFYLISTLRVFDNVCLPKVFRNETKASRSAAAMKLLERFGIQKQSNQYPNQLSGGQKQRAAIARALINNPEIILADEPVGNLDSESSRIVLEILRELNEKDKKTIVLVTHEPNHLSFGDRIIHMKDGRVVKEEVRKTKQKGGGGHQETSPKENIPPELQALMRSFSGIPQEYLRSLLAPFKAKQLMFHLLSSISEEQWTTGEKLMRERLDNLMDSHEFYRRLDMNMSDGGAGLNQLRAKSLSLQFENMVLLASLLREEKDEVKQAEAIIRHLEERFSLNLNLSAKSTLLEVLVKRLRFSIGRSELFDYIDRPINENGLGLNRVTAEKIVREIEMLFLVKY